MVKDILIKRLTTYAKIDTQSNEDSQTTPSTPGQWIYYMFLKRN